MRETVCEEKLGNSDARASCAVDHHAAVFFFLSCYFQGINDAGKNDDGCTVLVIVEDRDIEELL